MHSPNCVSPPESQIAIWSPEPPQNFNHNQFTPKAPWSPGNLQFTPRGPLGAPVDKNQIGPRSLSSRAYDSYTETDLPVGLNIYFRMNVKWLNIIKYEIFLQKYFLNIVIRVRMKNVKVSTSLAPFRYRQQCFPLYWPDWSETNHTLIKGAILRHQVDSIDLNVTPLTSNIENSLWHLVVILSSW